MTALSAAKPAAFDARGRLLAYAPPILAGFQGAPLALSQAKPARRAKPSRQRRNWARRRAYIAG
jgi:hypothetical protein